MSVTKRVLFLTLGLLLFLMAVCGGYWTYRQYRSYRTPIPREATSVVRIHVDDLIRGIAWNALWNRADYRDTTGRPSPAFDLKRWRRLGIPIPANLFLFQVNHPLSNGFPGVYFGSLAVGDPTALATWLRDNLGMEVGADEHGTIAFSEHALVVIQPKRALFALAAKKPEANLSLLTDVLINIFQHQDGNVAVNESDFRDIIRCSGQVNGMGTNRFAISFEKGSVSFAGRYGTDYTPDRQQDTPHFADTNAVSLWVQGGLAGLLKGQQFDLGGYALHGDSLLSHYNGRIAVEWKGTVTQQDTIVDYDYDDNFELVEKHEIVEKSVPEIYCSILADTSVINYLRAQGLLHTQDNTLNRDAFPLFRLGVSALPQGYVQLHTASEALAPPKPLGQNHHPLYLRVDFNKLQIPDLPSFLAPYMQAADLLELSGQPASGNQIAVHGVLRMKNPRLHSLVQLLALR